MIRWCKLLSVSPSGIDLGSQKRRHPWQTAAEYILGASDRPLCRTLLSTRMCGRFTIAITVGFYDRFGVEDERIPLSPRYNIAPSQDVPIIVRESPNHAVMMRWGLIPFWAKDPRIGSRMINARADTLATKPAFRSLLKRGRCLVPATGFYEWKKTDGRKAPYYIHKKEDTLFAFAGLHDTWKDPSGNEIPTFTIITTDSNSLVGTIHTRMPVILKRDDEPLWLREEPLEEGELNRLFQPYPADALVAYPVSPTVNSPLIDSPDLIRPVG